MAAFGCAAVRRTGSRITVAATAPVRNPRRVTRGSRASTRSSSGSRSPLSRELSCNLCSRGKYMRAWTVDADDIRVAEDFDDALLHRTPEIDAFLSLDRDDKFIVIGTKGFGKTLLLKAKRILYQQEGRAACLPIGNLLDKPIGDKIFTKDALTFFAASS